VLQVCQEVLWVVEQLPKVVEGCFWWSEVLQVVRRCSGWSSSYPRWSRGVSGGRRCSRWSELLQVIRRCSGWSSRYPRWSGGVPGGGAVLQVSEQVLEVPQDEVVARVPQRVAVDLEDAHRHDGVDDVLADAGAGDVDDPVEGAEQPVEPGLVEPGLVVVLQLAELVLEGHVLVDGEVLADPRLLDEDSDTRQVLERVVQRHYHLRNAAARKHGSRR